MIKGGLNSSAPIVQTSPYTDPTNNKYLPALVTGKQGIKLQFSSDSAPVTPTNIDGVIYSEGNIELAGYNANSISINLSGAIWAGKTIDMNNEDTLYTNIQTAINSSIIDNTEGFNLSLTKTQIYILFYFFQTLIF